MHRIRIINIANTLPQICDATLTISTIFRAIMAGRNPDRSSINIVDIVRRVVTTMNNLDSTSTNTSTPTNDVQSENNPSQRIRSCDEEVNDSFRLPRNGQPAQRQNGLVDGRFAPYRNREKKADDSKKASHIMKDVCLLPSPDWDAVPRRDSKQRLVRQNMFVDAWTLDKTWSEEQLRREILLLFKEQLTSVNE